MLLPVTNTINTDVCEGDSYTFADGSTSAITADVSLTTVLTGVNGCDSTVIENITMLLPVTNTINTDVCEGDTYTFADGSTSAITADVSLTTVLTGANGCDSTVIENVTMLLPVTNTINTDVCEGDTYTFADGSTSTITADVSLTTTLTAVSGCDSTVIENVTMVLPVTNTIDVSVCEGALYTFADGTTQTILANTTITTVLTSATGCDSTVVENVTMLLPTTNTVTVDICSGTDYTYADGTLVTSVILNETYTSVLLGSNGCDSIVVENLNVLPFLSNTVNVNLCEGETYIFADGTSQIIMGDISVVTPFVAISGCDSLVTENITVFYPVYNTISLQICENDTYTFANGVTEVITADMTVESVFAAVNGCDSIVTEVINVVTELPDVSFTFNPTTPTTVDPYVEFTNTTYNGDSYLWEITSLDTTNPYFWTSTDFEPIHALPEQETSYTVCLTAVSASGCENLACETISVIEDFSIYVPNAFTPNGDKSNEVFLPILNGFDIYNYELLIFNRWGEILFQSYDASVGWDGTYGNELVADGVYVWKIQVNTNQSDEVKSYTGHVTVLK